MVALPNMDLDPTLEKMFAIMEENHAAQPARGYLGASSIGDECERKLWYGYNGYPRKPMDRYGIMATEDGHRTEDLMAKRLRLVPGIQLWTYDEVTGEQYGFSKYDDKYQGHYDGIILGLLQAPKTPHVWENKACADKAFNAFKKSLEDYGEKNALENWNGVYYAQAQTYMGELKLDRHYTTVCLAGGRDVVSCRTEFDRARYDALDKKALRIITTKIAPARISSYSTFFKCKICNHQDECWKEQNA